MEREKQKGGIRTGEATLGVPVRRNSGGANPEEKNTIDSSVSGHRFMAFPELFVAQERVSV